MDPPSCERFVCAQRSAGPRTALPLCSILHNRTGPDSDGAVCCQAPAAASSKPEPVPVPVQGHEGHEDEDVEDDDDLVLVFQQPAEDEVEQVEQEEKRIDPSDGNSYTQEEFVGVYEGTVEWDAAKLREAQRGLGGGGAEEEQQDFTHLDAQFDALEKAEASSEQSAGGWGTDSSGDEAKPPPASPRLQPEPTPAPALAPVRGEERVISGKFDDQ